MVPNMFAADDERVPPYDRDLWMVLASAYPAGVPEGDYLPLIRALRVQLKFSFRALTAVLGYFEDRPWGITYNDVLGACAEIQNRDPEAERVLDRLRRFGLK
jgi:hypothetical protein